jgi:hypothetical protein
MVMLIQVHRVVVTIVMHALIHLQVHLRLLRHHGEILKRAGFGLIMKIAQQVSLITAIIWRQLHHGGRELRVNTVVMNTLDQGIQPM